MRIGDDPTGQILQSSLNVLSKRQQASLSNIANVDTPGYKAKEVPFAVELARATTCHPTLTVTNPLHIRASVPAEAEVPVVEVAGTAWRNDGNSVDVERELAKLAETSITYSAVAQQMTARLSLLRHIVTDGRS